MKANLTIEVYLTNEKGDRIRQITSGLVELRSHPLSPGLVMESQLHTPCTFNVPKNRDYKIEVTVNPREEHLRRDIQEGTKGRIIHLDGNMTETFTFISE
jgi:hypothetical protein